LLIDRLDFFFLQDFFGCVLAAATTAAPLRGGRNCQQRQ
jgi:hypothetical protein